MSDRSRLDVRTVEQDFEAVIAELGPAERRVLHLAIERAAALEALGAGDAADALLADLLGIVRGRITEGLA